MDIMKDTDPDVLKATFMNFFLNANIIGWPKQEQNRKKYNCNIPWAILLDPTSACNLHCTGCWAAEYGNQPEPDALMRLIPSSRRASSWAYTCTSTPAASRSFARRI